MGCDADSAKENAPNLCERFIENEMNEHRLLTRKKNHFKLWMVNSYGVYYDYGLFKTLKSAERKANEVLMSNLPIAITGFGRSEFIYMGKIFDTKKMIKEIQFPKRKQL